MFQKKKQRVSLVRCFRHHKEGTQDRNQPNFFLTGNSIKWWNPDKLDCVCKIVTSGDEQWETHKGYGKSFGKPLKGSTNNNPRLKQYWLGTK